jgi:hypothetical protein
MPSSEADKEFWLFGYGYCYLLHWDFAEKEG